MCVPINESRKNKELTRNIVRALIHLFKSRKYLRMSTEKKLMTFIQHQNEQKLSIVIHFHRMMVEKPPFNDAKKQYFNMMLDFISNSSAFRSLVIAVRFHLIHRLQIFVDYIRNQNAEVSEG